jgi:hypothetical protein
MTLASLSRFLSLFGYLHPCDHPPQKTLDEGDSHLIVGNFNGSEHAVMKGEEPMRNTVVPHDPYAKGGDEGTATVRIRAMQRIPRCPDLSVIQIDLFPMLDRIRGHVDNLNPWQHLRRLLIKMGNLKRTGMFVDIGKGRKQDHTGLQHAR